MSSDRPLQLLRLLQSRRVNRVDDIAASLGVTRRSVFRYLHALQESGIQIFWDSESGYHLPKGVSVPSLEFSPQEVTTILAGLAFLKSENDAALSEPARRLEARILNQLPAETRSYFEEVRDAFTVNPNQITSSPADPATWTKLVEFIVDRRSVTFEYRKAGASRAEKRALHPYHLVYYFDHWNVIGFDPDRNDLRSFIIDRIRTIEPGTVRFERPSHARELAVRRSENAREFRIAVSSASLSRFLRSFPAPIVSRETFTDRTEISFLFENEPYLNAWLLQFGTEVKLLAPDDFIERRKQLLRALLQEA